MVSIRIALNTETKPFDIEVAYDATVRVLKQLICREKNIDGKRQRLRLIFGGKLLDRDEKLLSEYRVEDGVTIHCAVSDVRVGGTRSDTSGARGVEDETEARRVGRGRPGAQEHVAIPIEGANDARIMIPLASWQLEQLRAGGLSTDDIATLQLHYWVSSGQNFDGDGGIFVASSEGRRSLRLRTDEEADDENISMTSDPLPDDFDIMEGSLGDFLWGILLGLVLGLIILVLTLNNSYPLSRRWRTGVIVGAGLNLWLYFIMLFTDQRRGRF